MGSDIFELVSRNNLNLQHLLESRRAAKIRETLGINISKLDADDLECYGLKVRSVAVSATSRTR